MSKHVGQYGRAREMLAAYWPHTLPVLREIESSMIAEIMVAFARMEVRRATGQREDA